MKWPCPGDYMSVWHQINLGSTQFFADQVLVSLVRQNPPTDEGDSSPKVVFWLFGSSCPILKFSMRITNLMFQKEHQKKQKKKTTQLFLLRLSLNKKTKTSKQLKKFNPKNLPWEKTWEPLKDTLWWLPTNRMIADGLTKIFQSNTPSTGGEIIIF